MALALSRTAPLDRIAHTHTNENEMLELVNKLQTFCTNVRNVVNTRTHIHNHTQAHTVVVACLDNGRNSVPLLPAL